MKLSRRPARDTPETIIALIDVVFFLLVFFMLVGRMDANAPFEVTPAIARTGSDMPGGGLTISIASDGLLALDGSEMSRDTLLTKVGQLIQSEPDRLVRINGHHTAGLRHLLPLVAEIEKLGARDVVLVVTPPAEP